MMRVIASPTPTPGGLMKLLRSMSTKSKQQQQRRPVLLQIISIVPALCDGDEEEDGEGEGEGEGEGGGEIQREQSQYGGCSGALWPKRGFYVKISDTAHSTYVCVEEEQQNLILSDALQLGHLVYVDRLQTHPLGLHLPPLALGLRPLLLLPHHGRANAAANAALPCLGNPQDIVLRRPGHAAHDDAPEGATVFFVDEAVDAEPEALSPSPTPNVRHPHPHPQQKRCISNPPRGLSPASGRSKDRDKKAASSSVGGGRGRSCSPVPPSKCVVPSLAKAGEESNVNGGNGSGPKYYVVPSRYRQPSPTCCRRTSSSNNVASPSPAKSVRRVSVSPVRKVSSAAGTVVASVRKKKKESPKSTQQDPMLLQTALRERSSDAKPEDLAGNKEYGRKVVYDVPELGSPPPARTCSKQAETEIVFHDKRWTDGSVAWDSVPIALFDLGQQAMRRRNISSVAAAEALQEASAAESVIRVLSMFSELCAAAKPDDPHPWIERFFEIHSMVCHSTKTAETLAAREASKTSGSENHLSSDNAFLWVGAALATDLAALPIFSQHNSIKEKDLKVQEISQESGKNKFGTHQQVLGNDRRLSSKLKKGGSELNETLLLAKALQSETQKWFLKFVENALEAGFHVDGEVNKAHIAAMLSQLKKVNDWLSELSRYKENVQSNKFEQPIEDLRRKIYAFLLKHVHV